VSIGYQYGKRKAQATPTVKPLVYSTISTALGGLWLYSCGFNRHLSVNKNRIGSDIALSLLVRRAGFVRNL
jgi:hypothetical protein